MWKSVTDWNDVGHWNLRAVLKSQGFSADQIWFHCFFCVLVQCILCILCTYWVLWFGYEVCHIVGLCWVGTWFPASGSIENQLDHGNTSGIKLLVLIAEVAVLNRPQELTGRLPSGVMPLEARSCPSPSPSPRLSPLSPSLLFPPSLPCSSYILPASAS